MKHRRAVYPGSFDPVTNGHVDIIRRASALFDELVVAVLLNRGKTPLFSTEERLDMLRKSVAGWRNVRVDSFSGLMVDYMRKNDMAVAIRGLRAVSDLEYEFQLAHTNRTLYPEMETVFLMPGENYVYLTSTTVREVASLGGELGTQVPRHVSLALRKKFSEKK
ncbi:MAG: pantetheine-phosphate adenylyltransferase [Elusimicrobiales bacterium]|nr:pantetheine-phosphate adenylyltransferase [Elusimicrobiales bacterium]